MCPGNHSRYQYCPECGDPEPLPRTQKPVEVQRSALVFPIKFEGTTWKLDGAAHVSDVDRLKLEAPDLNSSTFYKCKSHHLRTDAECFWQVWKGDKKAEYRKNDRDYRKGDFLTLYLQNGFREIHGFCILALITDVREGYGIAPGYAMLSISNLRHYKLDGTFRHMEDAQKSSKGAIFDELDIKLVYHNLSGKQDWNFQ